MTMSFQLIELPENEQVTSRQVTLPAEGGTIGRSYECTVQLPDFQRTLSRIHAEVLPHPQGGYQLLDRSANGVYVNDVLLGKGVTQRIRDGDKIKLGAYTLLISDMDALLSDKPAEEAPQPDTQDPASVFRADSFNLDSFHEDMQEISMNINDTLDETSMASSRHPSSPLSTQETPETFSQANVLGEDLYGYDPFEDEESWVMEQSQKADDTDDIVMLEKETQATADTQPKSQPQSTQQAIPVSHSLALDSSIDRLNQMIDQQQRKLLASIDRDLLMASIEATLDKFLDTFNPEQLEEEFNDYLLGWGKKDKKYWKLYKKQFHRKRERREFYRQFSSLLFEELRDKR